MAAPFKQVFQLGEHFITSLVVDRNEFDEVVDSLNEICGPEFQRIKEAGHIPGLGRGRLTEHVFDKYDVETNIMCVIVRGYGPKLAKNLGLI